MAANPETVEKDFDEMKALVGRLEREAESRVGKRKPVEDRWLDDLRQYHGLYAPTIEADLKNTEGKSSLYMNQTRSKTNAMEARLSDMLFPTDDRNWGITPTPVPELTVGAEEGARMAAETAIALVEEPQNPELNQRASAYKNIVATIKARMDEAKRRCRAMEEEIDDHLTECQYGAASRDVIRDACKLGTGVMKGPVTDGKTRRSWVKEAASNVYSLVFGEDPRPTFWRVDPWNFFPDMDASTVEDCDSIYERHLLNKKQMRRLAKQPGFDKEAIRTLLREDPKASIPTYLMELRSITSAYTDLMGDRYHVWEYHGMLTAEELTLIANRTGRTDYLEDLPEEIDPLAELPVVIWFCDGELLKFGIPTLDSNDPVYSVFNLERDEATLFGFGVPHLMRDSQKGFAAAWRVVMDNMGLGSGPQIVINDDVLEPVDGKWTLLPRKLWKRKSNATPDKKPFETFDIPIHLEELMALIEVLKKNIDEETALPMLAQGDQTSQITKTAGGMSILMNSVNIVFRRVVKNWDDEMTTPNIRRMYDYLMQFSKKEHIKGDYQVDARGTSVLLVREMQSANLMTFLVHFGPGTPMGKFLKNEGLEGLRRLSQVMMIPADEMIKSDAEVAKDKADAAKNPAPPDPEILKIEMMLNLEEVKGRNAKELETMRQETAMMTLAGNNNMKLEQVRAMLFDKSQDRASKERIIATEAAVEQRARDKDRVADSQNADKKAAGKNGSGKAGSGGGYF